MTYRNWLPCTLLSLNLLGLACMPASAQAQNAAANTDLATSNNLPAEQFSSLAKQLQIGDVVFIRVSAKPFREVAAATNSWTNHVGVVIANNGLDPIIAESTFPRSRTTTLSLFVKRSEQGRVAVTRLNTALNSQQQNRVVHAAQQRLGIWYDTGFNLHSTREFCSRYVREVLAQATGIEVGEVENFSTLLSHNPNTNLRFWQYWYAGNIPWKRETVTPASVLQSDKMHTVFDGVLLPKSSGAI